jgi:hypothetical protein
MAIAVGILKISTNKGVIREPPPTPVNPTSNPTINPENVYSIPIYFYKLNSMKIEMQYTRI